MKRLSPTLLLLTAALLIAAPLPLHAETTRAAALNRKFHKRTERPDTDSLNTNLCTLHSIYRERGFTMVNFIFLPDAEVAGDLTDWYLQDPVTAKIYRPKRVGKSHIQARRNLAAGFQYLAVTFQGMPEEVTLVNLHLPSLATHFLGIHLEADGENRVTRGPRTPRGEPGGIITEIITEEEVPEQFRKSEKP